MNKKVKKGLDIASIVLVVIILLISCVMLSLAFTRKEGVPRVFGVTFLDIQTDSMAGAINPGDVAVIKKIKDPAVLKEDDIITFWTVKDGQRVLNTHRIVKVNGNEDPALITFRTKGDNAEGEDLRSVGAGDLVGVYAFRLPGLGYFIRFLQSAWGFVLIIVLPLTLFLAYRIYVLVKVVLEMKKVKQAEADADTDALKAELEELRARVAALDASQEPAQDDRTQ